MDETVQHLYLWLLKRSAKSSSRRMRAAGLLQAAINELGLDLVEARTAFRALRSAGQFDYLPDMAGLPYNGYATINPPELVESPTAVAWRSALDAQGVSTELRDALLPAHELFADMEDEDRMLIVDALVRLRETMEHPVDSFGFSLSARQVLGSSKILDRLPLSARRALGVAGLPSTPRYVVVAGPSSPTAVLLVENTTTYEEAVRAGLDESVALIAAYGYGLNMLADSVAGWALVESLTGGRCEVLRRSGQDHELSELLQHPRLFFWGDLDREGLRIALALRSKLPKLTLSALYRPMRDMVRQRARAHPYALACGKANQHAWRDIGDATFDVLAMECATRAVDQEAVDLQTEGYLAQYGLAESAANLKVEPA